jgi:hypothetical protein
VRGTTRDPARADAIAAAGAEPYVGDPDRVGTLMEALTGVTIVVWLLGSASGPGAEELHDGRLRMLCEKLVDTPVRGLVYEAAGSLPEQVLAGGVEVVERAAATWNIPVSVVRSTSTDDAAAAVSALLA